MASALSSAAGIIQDSIALGRRTLRTAGWVVAATALLDFVARSFAAANPIDSATTLDPVRAVAGLGAAGLMLVDGAVIGMVSILLLPIQDNLLRGAPAGVGRASSSLVLKTIPLTVSGIVQGAIVIGPPTLLMIGAVAPVIRPVMESGGVAEPGMLAALLRTALWRAFWPALAWVVVVSALFVFSFPFLIFENRGPLRSIGLSAWVFVRSVPKEWGRMLGVLVLWLCLFGIVWGPVKPLQAAAVALTHGASTGAFFTAAWCAVTSALALVWWDAGLVVLFRKLVPAGA